MLLRPTAADVTVVMRSLGLGLTALGVVTLAVAVVALVGGDVDGATSMVVGGALGVGVGQWCRLQWTGRAPLSWTRAVVAATLVWTIGSVVAAVPLFLSGHYATYLDATFDAMSGLTTTGLTVVQDLDHLPLAHVVYRHVLELIGGLAIVVTGLTVLTATTATASSLAPSDVRDERILPSPERTWRLVTTIGSIVVGVGLVACTAAVAVAGVDGPRALLHGFSLAVAAATTGGFSVMSTSAGFYHSGMVEAAVVPLMLAGAVSFTLYRAAGAGAGRALAREFEIRTFLASFVVLTAVVMVGLGRAGSQTEFVPLLRRGLFTMVAAHTTTGLQVVSPRLMAVDWGQLAPAALVAAMTIGGMTGSAAGGLKTFRVGVIGKGVVSDVRRVLSPESALIVPTFTWGRRRILRHAHVRSAASTLLLLLGAALTGAVVVLYFEDAVDLTEALFVATSAVTNSGQSIGSLDALSSAGVKITFLGLMLVGRLEFLAVFATLGFLWAGVRGRG